MRRSGGIVVTAALLGLACAKKQDAPTEPNETGAPAASAPAPAPENSDAAAAVVSPIPAASIAAMVNRDNLPAYKGPTGSIEGTISVVGDRAPATPASFQRCPDAAKTYDHAFREASTGGAGPRPLADAIVGVTGYQGFFIPELAASKTVTIDGCAFRQRTVTMTFGQVLEVENKSADFWTPELFGADNRVLRMATPKGDPVRLYPRRPGLFRLMDHDRAYAYADVYVFLHPLHTVSGLDGHYRIDGVPVGILKVNTRHPAFDAEQTVSVDVRPNVVHKVDLTLTHRVVDAGAPPDAGRILVH